MDGLAAIVTGGSSGIGAAVVTQLAVLGARVAALDIQPPVGDSPAMHVPCDVSDTARVQAAVTTAGEALDGIDIVINNAGIGAQGTVAHNDEEEWARVLNINVTGIARVTRAAHRAGRAGVPWCTRRRPLGERLRPRLAGRAPAGVPARARHVPARRAPVRPPARLPVLVA